MMLILFELHDWESKWADVVMGRVDGSLVHTCQV